MTISLKGVLSLCLFIFSYKSYAQPKYEFRGVWVATGYNIDWPSAKNLSSEKQKTEFISLLEMHRRNGINAVIVQIRPGTDAFYPSQYEPWSEWLTGRQGKPPYPYYDPLNFIITETHKRGMEFHAWMNPYRAEYSIGRYSIAPTHITKLHPDWFIAYGGKRYFDPGNKEVQRFVNNVVRDVVSRYDVDAIHFDDYFYPYPIPGKEFPDEVSYTKYGNGLSKDDWRRSNVDSIIVLLSKTIKAEKKYCKFGISPFGVWRNNDKDVEGSNTRAGYNNYDDLYADILLWLKNKWIDYAAPQIYWERGHRLADFDTLVNWWANHNYNRHLYIGQGVYKVYENKPTAWKNKTELPAQINKIRTNPQVHGSVFYSSNIFYRNPNGWNDSLQNNYYHYPALIPPMPWISSAVPLSPSITIDSTMDTFADKLRIYLNKNKQENVNKYVIYAFANASSINKENAKNIVSIISADQPFFVFPLSGLPQEVNILSIGATCVTNTNNESGLSKVIVVGKKGDAWVVK
jgi:uncharacterized lipoprotein YddW (UPF0748 family)